MRYTTLLAACVLGLSAASAQAVGCNNLEVAVGKALGVCNVTSKVSINHSDFCKKVELVNVPDRLQSCVTGKLLGLTKLKAANISYKNVA